jgi:predicted metal-dependent phosphoesterase TrpH
LLYNVKIGAIKNYIWGGCTSEKMENLFVDMHVHSFYSDGSMSPDEIVESACNNGVGILAVADHDVIEGSVEIKEACIKNKIKYIPAVEIDSVERGINFHILAYGFDMENKEFKDFINHTRFLLDENGPKLIEAMKADYSNISLSDYTDFTYDRRLGGWKTLHYLAEKGFVSSLKEELRFYSQYNKKKKKSGYSPIGVIAYRIKKAGGYSVLAHPGELIDTTDSNYFRRELKRILSYGLDGVECYYPSHSEIITQICLDICRENDLIITAGSDCHGIFGKTIIGEMNISKDKVSLKNL